MSPAVVDRCLRWRVRTVRGCTSRQMGGYAYEAQFATRGISVGHCGVLDQLECFVASHLAQRPSPRQQPPGPVTNPSGWNAQA